jgi:hypothetical protein
MEIEPALGGWLKIESVATYDEDGNIIGRVRRFVVVRPPADVLNLIMKEDDFVEVEVIGDSEESFDGVIFLDDPP